MAANWLNLVFVFLNYFLPQEIEIGAERGQVSNHKSHPHWPNPRRDGRVKALGLCSICFLSSLTMRSQHSVNPPWPVRQPSEEGAPAGTALGMGSSAAPSEHLPHRRQPWGLILPSAIPWFSVHADFLLLSPLMGLSPQREVMSSPKILRPFSIRNAARSNCETKGKLGITLIT